MLYKAAQTATTIVLSDLMKNSKNEQRKQSSSAESYWLAQKLPTAAASNDGC